MSRDSRRTKNRESLELKDVLLAANSSDVQSLRSLVEAGFPVNPSSEGYTTALMLAAARGSLECVQILVVAGAYLDSQDCRGGTAIMYAVEKRREKCLQYLVDIGADIELTNDAGVSPVMAAIQAQELDCLYVLLEAGANPDVSLHGKTALMAAVENESADCLWVLLQAGADVNKVGDGGFTAVMAAVGMDKFHHMVLLIKAGASLNMRNDRGQTALMVCVAERSIESEAIIDNSFPGMRCSCQRTPVSYDMPDQYYLSRPFHDRTLNKLLDEWVDVNARDNLGRTALMQAVQKKSAYNVRCPLHYICRDLANHYRIDFNVQDNRGRTALMHAILTLPEDLCHEVLKDQPRAEATTSKTEAEEIIAEHRELVLKLIKKSDVNICDKDGVTALLHALDRGMTNFLPVFIKYGANLQHADERGMCALTLVISKRYFDTAQKLIEAKADVRTPNRHLLTPLANAVMWMRRTNVEETVSICRKMIRSGADVNARAHGGMTPLMFAVTNRFCDVRMVFMLIKEGADVNAVDDYNRSALIYALHSRCSVESRLDAVEILMRHKANPMLMRISSLVRVLGEHPERANVSELQWEDINRLILDGRDDIIRLVILNGIVPAACISHKIWLTDDNTEGVGVSPFMFTLIHGQLDVAKYFLANCYLTQYDLDYRKGHYLDLFLANDEREFLADVRSSPMPLVKLAFLTVSICLGASPAREERVRRTGLPVPIQRLLLFQTPMAKLCPHQWDKLPLPACHCGKSDNFLRPLLLYWPLCQCGFPKCDEKDCCIAY